MADVPRRAPLLTEDLCTSGGCKVAGGNGGTRPALPHGESSVEWNGAVWSLVSPCVPAPARRAASVHTLRTSGQSTHSAL